jgi:hypothetical protein
MTVQERIEWFFTPPDPEQVGLERSSLHQNRREVQDVFIRDVVLEDQVLNRDPEGRHALFATCMAISAGIDLLSKFYVGKGNAKVIDRFVPFLERYMFAGLRDAHDRAMILYEGVRCPVVHSFTLHATGYKVKLVSHVPELQVKSVWRFKSKPTEYLVSVEGLFTDYVKALNAHKAELLTTPDLQVNFQRILPDYGYIRMSDKPVDVTDLE